MLATAGSSLFAVLSLASPDSVWAVLDPAVRYLCLALLPPVGYITAVKEIDMVSAFATLHL